jgi:hypothetical protein
LTLGWKIFEAGFPYFSQMVRTALFLLFLWSNIAFAQAQTLKRLKERAPLPEWITHPPNDLPDRVLIIGTGAAPNEIAARERARITAGYEVNHVLMCPSAVILRWFDDHAPLTEPLKDTVFQVLKALDGTKLSVQFEHGVVKPEKNEKGEQLERVWLMGWISKDILRKALVQGFSGNSEIRNHLENIGQYAPFEHFLMTLDCF